MDMKVGLALLLAFFLVACDTPDDEHQSIAVGASGVSEDPASNITSFANAYPEELCKLNQRCDLALFSSNIDICKQQIPMPSSVSESTGILFSKSAAQACFDFLRNFDCVDAHLIARRDPSLLTEYCGEVIVGTTAVGDRCYSAFECVGGSACDLHACPGTCVVALRPSACGFCKEDEYCDDAELMCKSVKEAGDVCNARSECRYGLRCYEGTCVVGGMDGAPCAPAPCAEGWACVEGQNRTCERFIFGQQEGEYCGGVTLCGNDLTCDFNTSTCVRAETPRIPDRIQCERNP